MTDKATTELRDLNQDYNPLPLPAGWVEYIENPMTEKQRVVRCPLGAAPAWVQAKHGGKNAPATGR